MAHDIPHGPFASDHARPSSRSRHTAREAAPPVARLRVLVADDNFDAGDSLAMLLQSYGHEVCVARDGLDAVERALAVRPDVVLMDVSMPLMDGLQAARAIRAAPGGEAMFLVAVTGWGDDKDRDRTREAGFDVHVVKPMSLAELRTLLARVAATRR